MKNSWIHLAKGQTPRQAHVAVPKGLKEEELGRGGFHGRVANLYRLNEPTGWVRVEGDFAPGDVDGERVDTADRVSASGAPTRLFWNDDLAVSASRRSEPMPFFARNADADELYFVHRGEGTFETEFGPLEFRPGDYIVLPKGVTHRVVPVTRDNYFLHLESRDEIGLIEHPNLGRHNPYDPDVLTVPEPKAMQGDGRAEYEVRVKRAGRVTSFFYPQHPFDVVGWKGDLFPFRFHNTDFRPVTADRNHVPPSAFGLFCADGWVLCNFVPSPMQRDREASRLPYYHRNVDFDEIGFLHAGSIAGQPMEGTTIMWHPRGAVHGPGEAARAMADQFWSEIGTNDIQAVNVDCVRPLSVAPEAMAAKRDHVQLTVRKSRVMAFPQLARYPAAGPSLWSFEKLPDGTRIEPTPILAEDGGESHGTLFARGGERCVAMFMHPRGDMQRHYAMPRLLEAGIATFGQAGRFINNDVNLIHERLILDVAASIRRLRERGFAKIVLVGNSGGGALFSFYQSQAATAPPGRLEDTAAGDPCDLNKLDLPQADGLVQLATHLGQGKLMLSIIDPSLVDEGDPLSLDPELDMYDSRNGFRPLPESSKYAGEFLARYASAQSARVARIDAIARGHVAEWNHWLRKLGAPDVESLPPVEIQRIERRAFVGRYMAIHRTEAAPAYTDLSLHPSQRAIGSFFSPRPDVFNYLEAGFGKYQTPRAWLSTWSGHASRASTLDCLPKVTLPTLVVAYLGDNAVFSNQTDSIFERSPAKDKQIHRVAGDHLGYGPSGMRDRSGQNAALDKIVPWIKERFA